MDTIIDKVEPFLKDYNYIFDENYFLICEDIKSFEVNYIDITSEWLKNKSDNTKIFVVHKLGDNFKYKRKEYNIDGYNIVLDYKVGEVEFAKWLSTKTNKRIELFPRFNKPDGVKTANYKIGKEYFDYKQTTGSSSQLIYHNIEKAKGQSYNFIINITNISLSKHDIYEQLEYTFRRLKWVNIIGINSIYGFKVYKRK